MFPTFPLEGVRVQRKGKPAQDTMIRQISVAALSICIGACASSGPEAPAPAAMASSETVDAVASDNPASPSEDESHELDAAGVPEIVSASSENESDELVCRREKEAGSNFYRKVCFTRAQIEARAERDQEALRQMRSMKSGSQNETNPGSG